VSQFTKNQELDSTLASGIQNNLGRDASTHFDQRRTLDASGIVVNSAGAQTYVADGIYNLADYYPLTFNATGILRVDIRQQRECGDVVILNSSGVAVITAKPNNRSSRASAVTSTTINASGQYYAYIELKGRTGSEYKVGMRLS
jgi:hypothetical protein